MKPILSILMPGIRKERWLAVYNSILQSTKRSFELIIISPFNELPEELSKYANIKHYKDLGAPARCLQIASTLAEGQFLNFMADDGLFLPDALDNAINELYALGEDKKNIVLCKYYEGMRIVQPPEYYTMNYHASSRSEHFPNEWMFVNSGLIYREYFEYLGGIDCIFQIQPMGLIDFAVRANRDGANIKLIDVFLCQLDWFAAGTGDHQPIYDVQTNIDEPLFQERYKNGYEHLPIRIDINNWKQSPDTWKRWENMEDISLSGENKNVLITGITGSGGSYLAEYISAHTKAKIFGTTRIHNDINHKNIRRVKDIIDLTCVDLTDFPSLFRYLSRIKPDIIFHIASLANVRASFDTPGIVINNNINITLNLLECVRLLKEQSGYNPTILICSTSECYGNPDAKHIPITEDCPINPINPYSVSKCGQDQLSYVYYLNYGLNIIRTRMFSYLNAKRLDLFASSFAKQILDIKNGKLQILKHGNLSSIRSIIDVRDACSAYWIAANKGKFGEVYNIGGEEQISVEGILQSLVSVSGLEQVECLEDETLLRPSDVVCQVPDCTKFKTQTQWAPKYNLQESLKFFWDEINEFWS